ncbi:MAG TPA: type III-A CRISPR-associated RAMP protein Csm5 [Phycisphaerae bacterium]|nr:type III-A CRISPR-associated RAMP protein Csm5 [Phycisphaerae bacterium]
MPAYRMTLTMLSPVHIGTGEEIEPTEYVVRESDGAIFFHAVDFSKFVAGLDGRRRAEFDQAIDRGGTVHIRRFLADHFDPRRHEAWRSNANPDLLDGYREGLKSDSSQLIVHTMTRDPATGRAFLPGSSIKGAIRTAWLSHLAGQYRGPVNLDDIVPRDFEPEVLGYMDRSGHHPRAEIRADPFRALQVGDALLCEVSNTVDPVRIRRRVERSSVSDPVGIQMYYDTTFGLVDGEEIVAAGRLIVNTRLAETPAVHPRGNWKTCVAGGLAAEDLLKACNAFYLPKMRQEHEAFFARDSRLSIMGVKLISLAEKMGDGEALIRLGRFSHFECVTVDRFSRQPRRGAGNTRSLSCGEVPLGWARLRLDPA